MVSPAPSEHSTDLSGSGMCANGLELLGIGRGYEFSQSWADQRVTLCYRIGPSLSPSNWRSRAIFEFGAVRWIDSTAERGSVRSRPSVRALAIWMSASPKR